MKLEDIKLEPLIDTLLLEKIDILCYTEFGNHVEREVFMAKFKFDTFGVMIDCSRNAVMSVSGLKRYLLVSSCRTAKANQEGK